MRTFVALIVLLRLAAAAEVDANAQRGAAVFQQQKCPVCHTPSGPGDNTASKFDRNPGSDYTPAGVASRMWNHAPRMWEAWREAGLEIPRIAESDAADLFAFFYARHFFEQPGDATRGRRVFESKCARCHSAKGKGKAATEWNLPADSVELVHRMWNHAAEMSRVQKASNRQWPKLVPRELADLLVYLQGVSEKRSPVQTFSLPTGLGGKDLLQSKGCAGCHKGFLALEGKLVDHTLTDIAASLWNHAPAARERAEDLSMDEIREILAYLWTTDFFASRGTVAEGMRVFESRCATCHTNPAVDAPDLKKNDRRYTAITMVWALWNHGPRMLQEVGKQQRSWPELSESDMENLIAFLDFRIRNRGRPADVR